MPTSRMSFGVVCIIKVACLDHFIANDEEFLKVEVDGFAEIGIQFNGVRGMEIDKNLQELEVRAYKGCECVIPLKSASNLIWHELE